MEMAALSFSSSLVEVESDLMKKLRAASP